MAAPASFDPTDYGPEWAMADKIRLRPEWAKHLKMEPWGTSKCWHMYRLGSLDDAVAHCEAVIDSRLALQYIKEFRIGVTSDPIRRFFQEPSNDDRLSGYRLHGFSELRVLVSSDAPGVVGPIERKLLRKYRRCDYENKCMRLGHHLCTNQRKGGEGADFGPGPYYVYVVFSFNPGAPELRGSSTGA